MKNIYQFLLYLFLTQQLLGYPLSRILENSQPSYIQNLAQRFFTWQNTNFQSFQMMSKEEKRYFQLCMGNLQSWDRLLSPIQAIQHFSLSYKVAPQSKIQASLFCSPSQMTPELKSLLKKIIPMDYPQKDVESFFGLKWTEPSATQKAQISSYWIKTENEKPSEFYSPTLIEVQYTPSPKTKIKLEYTASINIIPESLTGRSFAKAVLSTTQIKTDTKTYYGYRLKDFQGPGVFNSESENLIRQILREFGLFPRYFIYQDSENYELFFP